MDASTKLRQKIDENGVSLAFFLVFRWGKKFLGTEQTLRDHHGQLGNPRKSMVVFSCKPSMARGSKLAEAMDNDPL